MSENDNVISQTQQHNMVRVWVAGKNWVISS